MTCHPMLTFLYGADIRIVPYTTPSISKSDLCTMLCMHNLMSTAQGPIWALCMIAALIVLLGPVLVTSTKLTNVVKALLALSVCHKKLSVCALRCIVWCLLAWTYFWPPLPHKTDEGKGGEEEEHGWEDDKQAMLKPAAAWTQVEEVWRDDFWKVVATMVNMGATIGTISVLLACKLDDMCSILHAMALVQVMVQRGGNMCHNVV